MHRRMHKLLLFLLKHGKKSLQSFISKVAALCITNCFSWDFEKTYRGFPKNSTGWEYQCA